MANYPHPQQGEHKHTANTKYKYSVRQDMKADRVAQAKARQELSDKRSPAERLRGLDVAKLDAVKERAKLARSGVTTPEMVLPAAPVPAVKAPKSKRVRGPK